MIAITGANGRLGTLVIESLLQRLPADKLIAAVRTPSKSQGLAERGVQVREADYSRPETLGNALIGATKVLLISGDQLGQRVSQHQAVIDAAKSAGTGLLAYTSILHADTSTLELAKEHLATERYLRASGIPFAMLRNGWYAENLTAAIAPAIHQGSFVGASKQGRFAAATRAEYAAAAVAVLTGEGHEDKTYELAGDVPFTREDLAAEVSRQFGKAVSYHDLGQAEYETILSGFLPATLSRAVADAEAKAAEGELDDTSHTLSRLIRRATKTLPELVADARANGEMETAGEPERGR